MTKPFYAKRDEHVIRTYGKLVTAHFLANISIKESAEIALKTFSFALRVSGYDRSNVRKDKNKLIMFTVSHY